MKSVNTVLDVPVDFSFFQMPKIDIKEIGPVAQMVDPVHKVIDDLQVLQTQGTYFIET